MAQRILWIVAGIVGCLAIALTSYVMFQPSKAPPEVVSVGGGGEGVVGGTATGSGVEVGVPVPVPAGVQTPAEWRANTILLMPKVEDAAVAAMLSPTIISVDCEKVSLDMLLQAFSDASKISFNPPRGRPAILATAPEFFSLHLQDKPLLEGLLQIQAQGISFNRPAAGAGVDQPWNVQYIMQAGQSLPGIWSITGPFAFAITNISHTVALDREGKPGQERSWQGAGVSMMADTVQMQITAMFEPKLKILRYPQQMELVEAVDEKGHSLIPAANPNVRMTSNSSNVNFTLRATLAYPPQEAGRRIKTLRGTVTYTLQQDSTPVQIDDPMNTLPTEKTFNGITAVIEKGVWNEAGRSLNMTVTYKRGNFAGDWTVQGQALAGIKPRIAVADDRSTNVNSNATVSGDTVVARYNFMLPAVAARGGALAAGQPTINSITFDFPTGAIQVAVPVEFHDLPLP